MDKNTIWAIVLSTLVIVGSYFLLPKVFGTKNKDVEAQPAVEVVTEEASAQTGSLFSEQDEQLIAEVEGEAEAEEAVEEAAVEEKITINTGLAQIVFTTKGGDILSYKLLGHNDKETNDFVELSDGITETNRTCALAMGGAANDIINEIFTYEKTDTYTILFKKNLTIKDASGKKRSYTLGKRYTFKQNEYMFKLEILIHSNDGSDIDFNGTAYTLRTSPQIGPRFNQKQNRYENRQFLAYNGKKTKKVILSSNIEKKYEKEMLWGGIAGKYFMELVIPTDASILGTPTYSAVVVKDDYANAQAMFERKGGTKDIQDSYYMYFGPREDKSLKVYNSPDKNAWNFGGYKITEAMQSSGLFSWLEAILKWCLEMLHKVISNWGICIIVLTLILKIFMFPLSKKQSLSSIKMQELQPKLQAIQKKYAGDQQKMQQETSKLYQEAGYNPAAGCLPMLFQFLIIIAMFNLFNNYFEFRGASFIPKWIPDLTEGDSVYTFKFNIPFLGNQLRILPIIYVGTQILSSWISQKTNPTGGQSEKTMKFMMYGMPFMFFFIFYSAPSGLLLYWLTSNVLQVGQQFIINKMMAKKRAEAGIAQPERVQKTLPPKAKAKQKK
ncbi:MAG: membrane protein insertase YidC [Treponema sp.]|nr:membrane protein insertase YidC [Treponema sp.]MBR5033465.1 membrane protein insertase YidC [Treponema sp.]